MLIYIAIQKEYVTFVNQLLAKVAKAQDAASKVSFKVIIIQIMNVILLSRSGSLVSLMVWWYRTQRILLLHIQR